MIDFNQVKGGKAFADKVANAVPKTAVVTTESEASEASDEHVLSEAMVDRKLSEVVAGFSREATDDVAVEGSQATTEFDLSCVPTDDKVRLVLNGVEYVENKHFTVDRSGKKVTWTYTAANGGFDVNEALADEVKIVYLTRQSAAPMVRTNIMGMVLVEEGNKSGTWARVDRDLNIVEFNPDHGTWAGIKQVQNDAYGEFTEIPVTYVKTETIANGPYVGKNCWWIADGPETGFHVHPAFIGQDGQPHNLQIASWIASNKNDIPFSEDKGNSKDGYWNNISYNTVRAKGWMTGGCRPYNIYDHHFLARLMLTEFGTPDVQAQTVDGVAWTGANRISYHGIHDPFGTASGNEYFWLDGLTTLNGTYQVLAVDGSGNMVETGVSCPNTGVWPVNCLVDQVNGIDFGDLFIANMANSTENSGSFADSQYLYSGRAFFVYWYASSSRGAFYLRNGDRPEFESYSLGWRVALCV